MDGASNDRTLEIVKSEGARVTTLISERDNGIYDAYNKGLSLATGEIIGFLNSDDFYFSTTVIKKVMNAFVDGSVDACYGNLVYVDRKNTENITRHWKSRPYSDGSFRDAFVPAHPTLFLRKSVYDRVGGFNLKYRLAADFEFMLRIFHKQHLKAVYIPETLVKMRTGGATGVSLHAVWQQNKEIRAALRQNNVKYSKVNYFSRKIIDRIGQSIRGGFQ